MNEWPSYLGNPETGPIAQGSSRTVLKKIPPPRSASEWQVRRDSRGRRWIDQLSV